MTSIEVLYLRNCHFGVWSQVGEFSALFGILFKENPVTIRSAGVQLALIFTCFPHTWLAKYVGFFKFYPHSPPRPIGSQIFRSVALVEVP